MIMIASRRPTLSVRTKAVKSFTSLYNMLSASGLQDE